MTMALCMAVTRLWPSVRAYWKAASAMRRLAPSVMMRKVSTTPGTVSCSRPE